MMGGWKTWVGAGIIGLVAALRFALPEYAEFWDMLLKIGAMLGLIGIGHKIEKASK